MLFGRPCRLSSCALAIALVLPAAGQSVISARSGLVHFFEGAVYLDNQPLVSHLGRFPNIPPGAELRTEQGRAEVLLTPGVFLRLGERSAIRLADNELADTQVELRAGSAIVDSTEPNPGTSVTLIYKDWRVRTSQKSIYRIDTDPPRVWALQGAAEVTAGPGGQPVTVERGMNLPLAGVLVPEASSDPPADALNDWARGRSESIAADNAITAQIGNDPDAQITAGDGFAYFPFLGLPSPGLGSISPYDSLNRYQPGFNSIYLPGYSYRPLWLGTVGGRLPVYSPPFPPRLPGSPGTTTFAPIPRPPSFRGGPSPARPSPHVGGVRGAHR